LAHHVFISYATPDRSIAETVCGYLEKRQIQCWMAPRDILPGTDFTESIHRAINESRTMVLIFSSHAAMSPHVLRETEAAVKRNLAIIPFRVEAVEPSGALQYYLGASHWLDAFPSPMDDHLRRLAESLEVMVPAVCAGRINRVMAFLIDLGIGFVLWVLLYVGVWATGYILMGGPQWDALMLNPPAGNTFLGNYVQGVVLGVTFFLYFLLLDQSRSRSSFGKLALRMIVVTEKRETAPRSTILIRDAVKCAPALFFFIPWDLGITFLLASAGSILLFLPAFLTRKQQAVHDMAAGTLVIAGTLEIKRRNGHP
jgi:uncharacterized RDD family membrane protein YckC